MWTEAAVETPGERDWLGRFIGRAVLLSLALVAVQVVVRYFLDSANLFRAGIVQAGVTAGFAIAWAVVTRGGPLHLAAAIMGYFTLAGAIFGATYVGISTGSLLLAPTFAIALVLPYLSRWRMSLFVTAALLTEVYVAAETFIFPPRHRVPDAERAVTGIGVVTLIAVLSTFLLLRFRARMHSTLATTEKALHRERELAESIPHMVFVATPEGRIRYTNARWQEYTGLTLEETVKEGISPALHPDDRDLAMRAWKRALRTRRPFEMEVRVRNRPDGPYRWHLSRAMPMFGDETRPDRWFGTLTDIEDQKQAEQRLQFLADASTVLGASLDLPTTLDALAQLAVPRLADWCVIHVRDDETDEPKPVAVAHADPKRAEGLMELLNRYGHAPGADQPTISRAWSGQPVLLRRVNPEFVEEAALFPGHAAKIRQRMTSLILMPLAARGHVFGVVTLVTSESRRRLDERDLTIARDLANRAARAADNARLYREAKEAVRAREDFLSVASHELKTPLTSLLLMVRTVQKLSETHPEQVTPEKLPARLDVIARQAARLERLINALLDVSRISAQKHRLLETERLDLAELARDVVARLRPDTEQLGSELRLYDEGPLFGRWDRLKVEQVLTNLLTNAAKFGAGKPIDVYVSSRGGRAVMSVRDRGRGIAPEDQARIFGRFERAVSQRQVAGMGLGLWIVRQLVDAMGGNVRLESRPGEGSTFTIDLPLEVSAQPEEPLVLH